MNRPRRKKNDTTVTWDDIYEEFKKRYPEFEHKIIYWRPYEPATIKAYTNDGRMYSYHHDEKIAHLIEGDFVADFAADRAMEKHKREHLKTLIHD